ncbi:MAG: PEP-CTERM sorting domain-containing protein [Oxalobacteraceae bacterium]|nr:MAG: PEP-CTERM sorting domain-containing protein [Oxalobacteraceae bacterium]
MVYSAERRPFSKLGYVVEVKIIKFAVLSLIACVTVLSATTAQATIIDFSSIEIGQYHSIMVGEYSFTQFNGQDPVVFSSEQGFMALGDDTSSFGYGSVFSLVRLDGGSFNIDNLVFGATTDAAGTGSARIDLGDFDLNRTFVTADGQVYAGDTAVLHNTTSLFINVYTDTGDVGIRSLDVSSVPEPPTWALLVTSLAAVGYTLRRRKA